jgi:uncharacterized protein YoxC
MRKFLVLNKLEFDLNYGCIRGANMMTGDSAIVLTMKQTLTGMATLVAAGGGVLWAVLNFTLGGVRDDVKVIRAQTEVLQIADKNSAVRIREGENKLIEQIDALRTEIAGLAGKLEGVNSSVSALSGQLQDVRKQLIARQSAWEDPKISATLARGLSDALKQKGFEKSNVVIVPFSDFSVEKK